MTRPDGDPDAAASILSPDAARRSTLAAITWLAAERGYRAINLDTVLVLAGVGESDFYSSFEDLEDAFCAAVSEGTEGLLHRALAAFAAHQDDWATALRAIAYELRDFLLEDPARARLMVVESHSACERSRLIREDGMAALAAFIDLGRRIAPNPRAIPPQTAELTAGAVYNRIHAAVEAGEPLSDEMVRELMCTAVRPYLGPGAALAELDAERPA